MTTTKASEVRAEADARRGVAEIHAAGEVIAARLRELVSGPVELHLERGRSSARIR